MIEIQAHQLKPKPNVEFERQFPLLSSLGLLSLFTVFQSKPEGDSTQVPIGIDPSLAQILGSLRFDLLMTQHDRSHTPICENDALYRFAWCLDAIRREKSVEQRHYDEMEEIFSLLHSQLSPLNKLVTSTSATSVEDQGPQTRTTTRRGKTTAAAPSKVSAASNPTETTNTDSETVKNGATGRPKRGASKLPEKTEISESVSEAVPTTRRDRSAAARNVIKQALGHADAEYDDLSEEEDKVTPARFRPKRLRKAKASKSGEGDDKLKDGKPVKKKAKKEEKQENWSDASEEDSYDDDGMQIDEGEDYVDFSEGEKSEDSLDDAGMHESDPSFESDEEDEPVKRKRAKRTRATAAKISSAKQAQPSVAGGLKVTLTGLTGTGTLSSQSAIQKDSSAPIVGGIKLKRGNQVLVDTAAALSSFSGANESRAISSIYTTVNGLQLESQLNLVAEYGWIVSTGSMQMTIQTVLFNILKDLSQRLSKPSSPAHCDPFHDVDTVKKTIISDKRISRLITLLQLGFFNFPILAGDGNDHHSAVTLQAEKIIDAKVTQLITSNNLAVLSTKPWTRKKIIPSSLNNIDLTINLLASIPILSAYYDRFETRNAMKEALKAENDDDNLEKEKTRYEAMMAMSSRHQNASGDVAPDPIRYLLLALNGADESQEVEEPLEEPTGFPHPDAAMSMVLFWTLTQAGSANEEFVSKIAQWTTENEKFWKPNGFWRLLSYPTFVQEVLFGFSKVQLYSPVGNLKPIMIDKLLMKSESQNSLLVSAFGSVQLMSYLYLALAHGSIVVEEATAMEEALRGQLDRLESKPFAPLIHAFRSAISYYLDYYRRDFHHIPAEPIYDTHEYHAEHHEEYHPQPSYSHDEHHDQ
jgi:hypothetical protein